MEKYIFDLIGTYNYAMKRIPFIYIESLYRIYIEYIYRIERSGYLFI